MQAAVNYIFIRKQVRINKIITFNFLYNVDSPYNKFNTMVALLALKNHGIVDMVVIFNVYTFTSIGHANIVNINMVVNIIVSREPFAP